MAALCLPSFLQKKDRRLDRIDGIKRKMDWDMDTRQLLAKLQNSGVRDHYSGHLLRGST